MVIATSTLCRFCGHWQYWLAESVTALLLIGGFVDNRGGREKATSNPK